jgi:Tfp pilus assembly protein PilO
VINMVFMLILLVAVIGTGVLTGWVVWTMSRLRRLESAREAGETGLLSSHLDELTAELSAVRDQLDMLEQRTEFSERLLEGRTSTGAPASPPATEATEATEAIEE